MVESDCGSFAGLMNSALSIISDLFAAQRCAFAICDLERGEIKDNYCLSDDEKQRRCCWSLHRTFLTRRERLHFATWKASGPNFSRSRCLIRSRGPATACLIVGAEFVRARCGCACFELR